MYSSLIYQLSCASVISTSVIVSDTCNGGESSTRTVATCLWFCMAFIDFNSSPVIFLEPPVLYIGESDVPSFLDTSYKSFFFASLSIAP